MKRTITKIIGALFVLLVLRGACGNNAGNGESIGSDLTGSQDYAYRTVTFEETNNLCADNPGQGWVVLEEPLRGGLPSLGYEGDLPEVKAVSLSTAWSCFEETPGKYDWSLMDETIAYWAERGKTINLRLCTDSLVLNQGVVNGCPDWLFHEPYNVPYVVNEAGSIVADLSNKVYQEELRKFLAEFTGHYTAEDYPYRDSIEVVELRGYGEVGEWHSGWYTYKSVDERTQALRNIIEMWREAWGDKLLAISCTYEFLGEMRGVVNAKSYEDFMRWMGYDRVLTLDDITFRRDGIAFALRDYDSRMATDYFYMNTGLPLLGEIGGGYYTHTDSDSYPLFEAINEALHKWRVNYNTVIGWVAQEFSTVLENETEITDYFVRMKGFRFIPNQVQYSAKVKAGDKLYLNTLWSNQAMGRAWSDYDLSIYLEDSDGNTVYAGTDTSFNPVIINGGEPHFFSFEYSIPEMLENGIYTLKFAISDENGIPVIEMPIPGNDGTNKYYLGKILVGDEKALDLSVVDNLNGETSFIASGSGVFTRDLVNVDGSDALVGYGNGMFAFGPRLENGKTYYISFEYRTNKDKNTVSITDESKYIVGAYNVEADIWSDVYEWLDVSNNLSHRSAVIRVPDDGNTYNVAFGCKNSAAEIAIDNISVIEADVIQSTFHTDSQFAKEVSEGEYKIKQGWQTNRWGNGLYLNERLDAHTTYMITFEAETVVDVSNGGFFYVTLLDPNVDMNEKYESIESFSLNRIGSFWAPKDYGYHKYSYVFNTGDYGPDWDLVFGVRKVGVASVKNITITRIESDCTYIAEDEMIERNVIPEKNIDVDTNGVAENFEAGVFNGGCMYPGKRSTGIINQKHVISGNYSCYIENFDPNHAAYESNDFCMTNLADLRFSANTAYRVRFKFMILEPLRKDEDSSFFCSLDGTDVFKWHSQDYEVGEVYTVECGFTTGDSDSCIFSWGIRGYGALAIDDVTFEKSDNLTGLLPAVTRGHGYQITQEVLYKRNGE